MTQGQNICKSGKTAEIYIESLIEDASFLKETSYKKMIKRQKSFSFCRNVPYEKSTSRGITGYGKRDFCILLNEKKIFVEVKYQGGNGSVYQKYTDEFLNAITSPTDTQLVLFVLVGSGLQKFRSDIQNTLSFVERLAKSSGEFKRSVMIMSDREFGEWLLTHRSDG